MDPVSDKPDVLGKIDALLTRHRSGAPSPQKPMETARASIPVLSDVVAEPHTIPVLTDALPAVKLDEFETETDEKPIVSDESAPADHAATGKPVASLPLDDETLRRTEEFLIRELEDRIAIEFSTILDRALTELLDNSREHVRRAVREALGSHLKKQISETRSN